MYADDTTLSVVGDNLEVHVVIGCLYTKLLSKT